MSTSRQESIIRQKHATPSGATITHELEVNSNLRVFTVENMPLEWVHPDTKKRTLTQDGNRLKKIKIQKGNQQVPLFENNQKDFYRLSQDELIKEIKSAIKRQIPNISDALLEEIISSLSQQESDGNNIGTLIYRKNNKLYPMIDNTEIVLSVKDNKASLYRYFNIPKIKKNEFNFNDKDYLQIESRITLAETEDKIVAKKDISIIEGEDLKENPAVMGGLLMDLYEITKSPIVSSNSQMVSNNNIARESMKPESNGILDRVLKSVRTFFTNIYNTFTSTKKANATAVKAAYATPADVTSDSPASASPIGVTSASPADRISSGFIPAKTPRKRERDPAKGKAPAHSDNELDSQTMAENALKVRDDLRASVYNTKVGVSKKNLWQENTAAGRRSGYGTFAPPTFRPSSPTRS